MRVDLRRTNAGEACGDAAAKFGAKRLGLAAILYETYDSALIRIDLDALSHPERVPKSWRSWRLIREPCSVRRVDESECAAEGCDGTRRSA
jgi:hypothetical protein